MPAYRGVATIAAKYRGATPIREQRRGSTLIWTSAPIFDGFDNDGWLSSWINELLSEDPAALISDAYGQLIDGLDNLVGSVVAFVQGGINQIGSLITYAGSAAVNAYCGAWGGSAPPGPGSAPTPDGLLGLINGIPLIGPFITTALTTIINGIAALEDGITHLVGQIPVVGNQLATAIGLIPDQISGILGPPINYVIDQLGAVIGTLTCGAYTPTVAGITEDIQYVIGIIAGRARMLIPDGLMSLDTRTSRYRWPTPLTSDDGFIEVRMADAGSPDMMTQVFRRYSDSGYHNGVGMQFSNSQVSIVKRASNADSLVVPNAAGFGGGDRLRLDQQGTTHVLTRNGREVASWTGSSTVGAGTRSVGMLMQGGKELLGQRRFSPALDYLEAA